MKIIQQVENKNPNSHNNDFDLLFRAKSLLSSCGGGGGIRTPGGLRLNGFQDRRYRPLSHPSGFYGANAPTRRLRGGQRVDLRIITQAADVNQVQNQGVAIFFRGT